MGREGWWAVEGVLLDCHCRISDEHFIADAYGNPHHKGASLP
jgi:hypothetical protein